MLMMLSIHQGKTQLVLTVYNACTSSGALEAIALCYPTLLSHYAMLYYACTNSSAAPKSQMHQSRATLNVPSK